MVNTEWLLEYSEDVVWLVVSSEVIARLWSSDTSHVTRFLSTHFSGWWICHWHSASASIWMLISYIYIHWTKHFSWIFNWDSYWKKWMRAHLSWIIQWNLMVIIYEMWKSCIKRWTNRKFLVGIIRKQKNKITSILDGKMTTLALVTRGGRLCWRGSNTNKRRQAVNNVASNWHRLFIRLVIL